MIAFPYRLIDDFSKGRPYVILCGNPWYYKGHHFMYLKYRQGQIPIMGFILIPVIQQLTNEDKIWLKGYFSGTPIVGW